MIFIPDTAPFSVSMVLTSPTATSMKKTSVRHEDNEERLGNHREYGLVPSRCWYKLPTVPISSGLDERPVSKNVLCKYYNAVIYPSWGAPLRYVHELRYKISSYNMQRVRMSDDQRETSNSIPASRHNHAGIAFSVNGYCFEPYDRHNHNGDKHSSLF